MATAIGYLSHTQTHPERHNHTDTHAHTHTYTPCPEKRCHFIFACNCAKC